MDITEREKLHKELGRLKRREKFPETQWANLVEEAVRIACTSESRLYKDIVDLNKKSESRVTDENEKEYIDLLSAAQDTLKITPQEHPDTELEREIKNIFNDQYFSSLPFKISRNLLIAFLVLMFGGSIYFGFETKGFINKTKEAIDNLKKKEEDAQGKINEIVESAQNTLKEIREEVWAEEIAKKKEDAINAIENALRGNGGQPGALNEIKETKTKALGEIATALSGEDGNGGALKAIEAARGNKNDPNSALGQIEAKKENAVSLINQALGMPEERGGKVDPNGALGQIEAKRADAVSRISQALGASEETGALAEIENKKDDALDEIAAALSGKDEQVGALNEIRNKKDSAMVEIAAALSGEDGQGGALKDIEAARGNKSDPNSALGQIETKRVDAVSRINQALGTPEKEGALGEIEKIKADTINELKERKKAIIDKWEGMTPKNVNLSLNFTAWCIVLASIVVILSFAFSAAALIFSWKAHNSNT